MELIATLLQIETLVTLLVALAAFGTVITTRWEQSAT